MIGRIDGLLQDRADRFMWVMEQRGIHAPQVLRELLSGTIASNGLLGLASLVQSPYLSIPMIGFCLWISWMLLPRWRIHDADASKDWTIEMAQKYAAAAMRKQHFYAPSRPLMLLALVPYALVLAVFASSQYGLFYLAIFVRMVVLQASFYLECAMPAPPPPPRAQSVALDPA